MLSKPIAGGCGGMNQNSRHPSNCKAIQKGFFSGKAAEKAAEGPPCCQQHPGVEAEGGRLGHLLFQHLV